MRRCFLQNAPLSAGTAPFLFAYKFYFFPFMAQAGRLPSLPAHALLLLDGHDFPAWFPSQIRIEQIDRVPLGRGV
jgi:hypothetical protein